MADRLVTVFGGSGFVGRHLINKMVEKGWRVRVASRDIEKAKFLKPLGQLGQVSLMPTNVNDEASVRRACAGADAVINLIGILHESGKSTFDRVHAEVAGTIARIAKEEGVRQYLHMSALGASKDSESAYARSKAAGEERVRAAFPEATLFRPSVIFGPEDDFYNRFGVMARLLPALVYVTQDAPALKRDAGGFVFDLYGSGGPKLQPVYVGDVAEAMLRVLEDDSQAGKTFELGGPEVYSLREIMQQVVHHTRHKRPVLPMPMWMAKIQAAVLQYLPKPPLTPDQVKLLSQDNVVSGQCPGLRDLGIEPELADAILPRYLERFRTMHRQIRRLGRRGV